MSHPPLTYPWDNVRRSRLVGRAECEVTDGVKLFQRSLRHAEWRADRLFLSGPLTQTALFSSESNKFTQDSIAHLTPARRQTPAVPHALGDAVYDQIGEALFPDADLPGQSRKTRRLGGKVDPLAQA